MNEEQAKAWAKSKANQERVVKELFRKYKHARNSTAIFMAGIPGAGKTEFAENLVRETAEPSPFVPIEHDKLVEFIDGYTPETYYNYRKAGSILVTRVFNECIRNDYSFVFDGTLSHENGLRNIKKALTAGYFVAVFYIVQDAQAAWELTLAREAIKKRSIEKAGFIETCNRINANLSVIFEAFKDNPKFQFIIFHKHGTPGMENATSIVHAPGFDNHVEIEKALQAQYNIKSIG